MNCREFEKHVLDLTRDRLIDAPKRESAVYHADVCARCGMRLAEELTLLAGIRAVVAEMSDDQTSVGVGVSLLAEFRKQHAVLTPVVAMPVRQTRRIAIRVAAIAAGIVLLISVFAALWSRPSITRDENAINPGSPDKKSSPAPVTKIDENPSLASARESLRPRKPRHRPARNNSAEAEVTTQFFPLMGNTEDLSSLENVRVVRVELLGTALGAVGLPIVPENRNTPVKADVVLGPDGSARAIRFVR